MGCSRGVNYGGRQSSLRYLFGGDEATASARQAGDGGAEAHTNELHRGRRLP
jgi:hypothetical protein